MLRRSASLRHNRLYERASTDGMTSAEIVKKYCYRTWTAQKSWNPINIVGAKDCWFWDDSGKKYLDFSSQRVCANLGHQNEAVVEAICKQADELAYIGPGYAFDKRAAVASKLLEVVPPGIDKFFFPTSGTCANEAAIKVARFVTGKHQVIARYNSYHGSTAMSLACTADWRQHVAERYRLIENQGVIHIPEYNNFRPGPLGLSPGKHMDHIEYVLQNEPNVAAIILEPIVGSNGVLIPPDDYWPRLRYLTKKYDVILIADEIMTSFGRCGEWFAVDKWGVTPDIITTAKGVTASATPLGIMGTTREIADYFDENTFSHGHTFESHPMTLAPAVAAISEYQRLNLIEYARKEGAKLGQKLMRLKEKHPSVGDVRGCGMFWGIDLVKNRKTKEPFVTNVTKSQGASTPTKLIAVKTMEMGCHIGYNINMVIAAPPLIVNEEEMDFAVQCLDEALKITDAMVEC